MYMYNKPFNLPPRPVSNLSRVICVSSELDDIIVEGGGGGKEEELNYSKYGVLL